MPDGAHFLKELKAGLPDGNTEHLDPIDEYPEHDEIFEAISEVYTALKTGLREISDIVDNSLLL